MDIKKWFQPETTKKAVFEGVYPVIITAAKAFTKEVEKDDKTFEREIISLTFRTLQAVPFPDKTNDKITVEQNYYFDVPMHQNALNGVARAFGVTTFNDTSDFEGKTGIIGITNRTFDTADGEKKTVAQMGYGLFSYAPLTEKAKIEYIGNTYPEPTEQNYKDWFKDTLAKYKQPK